MRARCYRCQSTFETDHFGTQTCPACHAEVYLPDPGAPPPPAAPPQSPSSEGPGGGPAWGSPPVGVPTPPPAPPPPSPWGAAPGWVPPPPPPPPIERSAPFAERGRLGFFSALVQTWKLVAFEPARFFREVRVTESRSAVLFGLLLGTLGGWISLVIQYFTAPMAARWMAQMGERQAELPFNLNFQATPRELGLQLLLTPLFTLGLIYFAAGVLHVALVALRGAPRGFAATLTVVGYAFGLSLIIGLPFCFGLVGLVWFAVVLVLGLAAAQRCNPGKALVALLALCVLACCLCVAFAGGLTWVTKHNPAPPGSPGSPGGPVDL